MKKIFKLSRYFLLIPILICLLTVWITCLAFLLPFIITGRIFYGRKRSLELAQRIPGAILNDNCRKEELMFDRKRDVPKLQGCNIRNVKYRWTCFSDAIKGLMACSNRSELKALDLGAGSLRETYELSRLGFKVTAIDFDAETLNKFKNCYNWDGLPYKPDISTKPLNSLDKNNKFQLVLAFDVLEHNLCYQELLLEIKSRLSNGGLFFVTVPNGRSLIEMYWKLTGKYIKKTASAKGEAHVVFLSPQEWRDAFTKIGFKVTKHDMTIGYLVNTWRGFFSIPIELFIEPVIRALFTKLRLNYVSYSVGELFYPKWLMESVHFADLFFEPLLKNKWGWNLFILTASF
jgi:2-polyprenyl-3-methyl-5-hydroxy-6-metoxy-1,4-benzoquinol methylase